MYENKEIYIEFRKAQSNYLNRGYKLPKDWTKFEQKMLKQNLEKLNEMTTWFNTKFQNVDPFLYFKCGFEIFDKGFSYNKFLDSRIINYYKLKQASKNRQVNLSKKNLVESIKFMKKYLRENEYEEKRLLYANLRKGHKSIPIEHYLKQKIDIYFLMWLIRDKILVLNDNDRLFLREELKNFNFYINRLYDIEDFLKKLKEKI